MHSATALFSLSSSSIQVVVKLLLEWWFENREDPTRLERLRSEVDEQVKKACTPKNQES